MGSGASSDNKTKEHTSVIKRDGPTAQHNMNAKVNRHDSSMCMSQRDEPTAQMDEQNKSTSDKNKKVVKRNASQSLFEYSTMFPPPPRPPKTRKADFLKKSVFLEVDQYVARTPVDLSYGTFDHLVTYLTSPPGWTDVEKFRAIFKWAISLDDNSLQLDRVPALGSPLSYFINIRSFMATLAGLIEEMCMRADIPCQTVVGMKKNSAYELGQKVDKSRMGGSWNAVYIAGSWRFVDAIFASQYVVSSTSSQWALMGENGRNDDDAGGDEEEDHLSLQQVSSVKCINEFYFFTDPDHLISSHFPDDPDWQLLEKPVTLQQYEESYFSGKNFYLLGMHNVQGTQLKCVVESESGHVDFIFGLPKERSSNFQFKYKLYRERSNYMENAMDPFLNRFVFFEQRENFIRFRPRLPMEGTFRLDIFGGDMLDEEGMDHCVSYIINICKNTRAIQPLPDAPPRGWGPMPFTRESGLKPLNHKNSEIVTKDGCSEIHLNKEKSMAFHQMLKNNYLDEAVLSKYSLTEVDGDDIVVHLRLPRKGEYSINMFSQNEDTAGEASNVLNYLVDNQFEAKKEPFPNVTNGRLGRNEINSDEFGVKALTHNKGRLVTKNGKLTLEFEANSNVEIICEIHTNDGLASSSATAIVSNNGKDVWKIELDLPVEGEYSLNVFARMKDGSRQIYNLHTYLINSHGQKGDTDSVTSDDFRPNMVVMTETVETSEREVSIPLPESCPRALASIHRRTGNEAPDPDQIEFLEIDDNDMCNVKMDGYGEFMVNLYDTNEEGTLLRNFASYQINRRVLDDLVENERFQEAFEETYMSQEEEPSDDKLGQARRMIKEAIELQNRRKLEDAINTFLYRGGNEYDPLLTEARQQLKMIIAKKALALATQQRDKVALAEAIIHAKSVNVNKQLDVPIAMAEQLRAHLLKMEKLRHNILKMEAATMNEMRSYQQPPYGVHQCMMATYVLLGHSLREVKNWQRVQALLGMTGSDNPLTKISNFDMMTVSLEAAQAAKATLKPFNIDRIHEVSACAATFFAWASRVVSEVEAIRGGDKTENKTLRSKNKSED